MLHVLRYHSMLLDDPAAVGLVLAVVVLVVVLAVVVRVLAAVAALVGVLAVVELVKLGSCQPFWGQQFSVLPSARGLVMALGLE